MQGILGRATELVHRCEILYERRELVYLEKSFCLGRNHGREEMLSQIVVDPFRK